MGAINKTYLKMGDYSTPMIHLMFSQLVRLLEERRQTAVSAPRHGDKSEIYVAYVERLNMEIMNVLGIPWRQEEDNAKLEQQVILLRDRLVIEEDQRSRMKAHMAEYTTALDNINLRMGADIGRNIDPAMVHQLYDDIGKIINQVIKK